MAAGLGLLLLAAAGGAYLLMAPTKKQGASATGGTPVVVPPSALPVPPGGVPAEQMPGGPPTVVVTPPATSSAQAQQTPQQILTQAIPNLLAAAQQALPQLAPQTAVKEVPAPGQPPAPTAAPTVVKEVPPPGQASPAPTAPTPQQVLTAAASQLPTAVTQVLQQAGQILPQTPLQTTETHPAIDTNGTIALAKSMIDREQMSGWKSALQPDIMSWQRRVGLTGDGKFGPGSALRMAQEVGILPVVRYWPASSQKNVAVPQYQSQLRALADSVQSANPAHAEALRLSAAFEQGQTYGTDNPPIVPLSARTWQADQLQVKLTGQ
jgi:hypothetical protein